MNKNNTPIYFLNENINNYECLNEGLMKYVAIGAVGIIAIGAFNSIIYNLKKKNVYLNEYDKSDLKIRTTLATYEYALENIYKPINNSILASKIEKDDNDKYIVKNPSNIINTIFKCYKIKNIEFDDYNVYDKINISDEIINKITEKVLSENNGANDKSQFKKFIKQKYPNEFKQLKTNYSNEVKRLITGCKAIYIDNENPVLTFSNVELIYMNLDANGADYVKIKKVIISYIRRFVGEYYNIERTAKDLYIKFNNKDKYYDYKSELEDF